MINMDEYLVQWKDFYNRLSASEQKLFRDYVSSEHDTLDIMTRDKPVSDMGYNYMLNIIVQDGLLGAIADYNRIRNMGERDFIVRGDTARNKYNTLDNFKAACVNAINSSINSYRDVSNYKKLEDCK